MTDEGDTRRARHRGALAVAAGFLYRFTKSHRAFDAVAVWVSRRVRESPPSSPLNVVLGPVRARFRGQMRVDDVLGVVEALQSEGVRFWIAGGWGVDLLAGSQTRRHDDLDVVLADYEGDEARACRALARLGYRQIEILDGLWMTPRNLLDDGVGHQIEILGIDRDRLEDALDPSAEASTSSTAIEKRRPELFTTGTLGGRRVPCLSARLQLLFHTGFDPRGVDGRDLELLQAEADPGDRDSAQR